MECPNCQYFLNFMAEDRLFVCRHCEEVFEEHEIFGDGYTGQLDEVLDRPFE